MDERETDEGLSKIILSKRSSSSGLRKQHRKISVTYNNSARRRATSNQTASSWADLLCMVPRDGESKPARAQTAVAKQDLLIVHRSGFRLLLRLGLLDSLFLQRRNLVHQCLVRQRLHRRPGSRLSHAPPSPRSDTFVLVSPAC